MRRPTSWVSPAAPACRQPSWRVLISRFYGRNHMIEVIVLMGCLVALQSAAGAIWGYNIRAFPSPFGTAPLEIAGYSFRRHDLVSLGIMLTMLAVVFAFFRFTIVGLAMRASALNPASSRLCGVPVSWMLASGWGLASVVSAVSAMMVAPILFLDPTMMSSVLLYAFAASLLGGVTNPVGAVVAGFLIGVIESAFVALVPGLGNELKLTLVLFLIIVMLLVRPQGLFGEKKVGRV